MNGSPTRYDVVIATRNRPDVLRVSIPLLLEQSVPPSQLIVIDSSDDHRPVRDAVLAATARARIPVVVEHAAPSAAAQRNRGVELVRSPVVFFPDDDSLYFPDTADRILRVYESDKEQAIGGVCAAESPLPPPKSGLVVAAGTDMDFRDRFKQRFAHTRARIEKKVFPDPFVLWGQHCIRNSVIPEWFVDHDVVPVEWMTGFRMTFRTETIRKIGFGSYLGRYSLFEDTLASFEVWKNQMVVGARRAKIFHYKAPGRRTGGTESGIQQILNRACIVVKNAPPGSLARRRLKRYARYKIAQYTLGARGQYGRERLIGARRAAAMIDRLLAAEPDQIVETYQQARSECLTGFGEK